VGPLTASGGDGELKNFANAASFHRPAWRLSERVMSLGNGETLNLAQLAIQIREIRRDRSDEATLFPGLPLTAYNRATVQPRCRLSKCIQAGLVRVSQSRVKFLQV